jgi:hypothetical protein
VARPIVTGVTRERQERYTRLDTRGETGMPLALSLLQISLFALFTLLIGLIPLAVGLVYAVRPGERWLALMRPVSLAAIFAGLSSLLSGTAMVLREIGQISDFNARTMSPIALGLMEAITPMFLIFACLTVAWVLVAVGMRRTIV